MYHILKIGSSYTENGKIEIFASLDGEYANANGTGYLYPRQLNEHTKVKRIEDIHGWIGTKPFNFYGFPISEKMKLLLEEFNLYEMSFLKTTVLFQEKKFDYYGWKISSEGFDKYVDFENSRFCQWKQEEKYTEESLKFNNLEEIIDYELEHDWWKWGFDKAVMKPNFKEIDCMGMPYPYGILISERLKNALEETNLTGFDITPFPLEFEYL